MFSDEENILSNLNQIILFLIEGKMDSAIDLLDKTEPALIQKTHLTEFIINLRKFIKQYQGGAVFLNALANGNLVISPPDDPLHENYMISQYKQLHSNLSHLTWQMQQIAKGDLRQKVSFLGEFSIAFNKMIGSLREKKLMEEKINLQNEQLQKLNYEKDKFFSIIAHDLRSPFNGFLGLTQLMAEELPDMSLAETQKIASSMKNSATNLFRLLENLLDWSTMQQGLISFNREVAQLSPIVEESIAIIQEPAKIKGIEIVIDIPVAITVYADRNILQTVIRNIVTNAVKFTRSGGRINVTAKSTGDNSVEVSIKDSGIGMSQSLVNDLFRLDIQTNRKGTDGEPSTGLGLILCKDFIEMHGGKLWVVSEEGKGSAFYFTIPYNADPKK